MKYMLDTNICIHFLEDNPLIIRKFKNKRDKDVGISTITLAELEYGVYKNSSYEINRNKLLNFLKLINILSFDDNAAMCFGIIKADLLRKKKTVKPYDTLIAAHAISTQRIMVTDNICDFNNINRLKVENWIKP